MINTGSEIMMLYCSKCRVVTDKEACPSCGRKKLRAPEPDDAVLLTAGDVRALEAVFDLLKAKGILSDLYADAKGRDVYKRQVPQRSYADRYALSVHLFLIGILHSET